jgi:hypothetical protein
MKVKTIENIDYFGEDTVFTVNVEGVDGQLINMAKMEDQENYNDDCFGVWVNYDSVENEYYICQDNSDSELFYVTDNGDKLWLPYVLTKEEAREVINACKNAIR